MFQGRASELKLLKDNYDHQGFRMVVLYGRRRVGKSYLMQHFLEDIHTPIIAFQAIEHSKALSIEAFQEVILDVYPSSFETHLSSWKDCFRYIHEHCGNDKLILYIDEVNYIFREDASFASILQEEIDHHLIHQNVMLILCGSHITSIEHEILNENAPLYGRRSLSIHLEEFNYKEASVFYPNYSPADKVIAYAVFGGKGKYLASINPSRTIKENIIQQILTPGGALADEIPLLLKDDFRDPTFYQQLLYTMSLGNTTFNDIKTKMNEEAAKVSTYLNKLIDAKIIIKKEIAGGKRNDSRYFIQDHFLSFYFRFVYKRSNILNVLIKPEAFYERFIEKDLSTYVGTQFENICEQYIILRSLEGELPFLPLEYGKYFGKRKDNSTYDIDVYFADEEHALCGECKFANRSFSLSDMKQLIEDSKHIQKEHIDYYVFYKSSVDASVKQLCPTVHLISLETLYH